MIISQQKNKAYAIISILLVFLIAVSFIVTVNFLLKIENLAFNTDERIIKEKTTTLDKEGFEKIKVKLEGTAGR